MRPQYSVYKGLQKPLVLKGFKGRYIYWGVGAIAGSVIGGAIMGLIFQNTVAGVISIAAFLAISFFYISIKQTKGLHTKSKTNSILVIQTNLDSLRKKYYVNEKKDIQSAL